MRGLWKEADLGVVPTSATPLLWDLIEQAAFHL